MEMEQPQMNAPELIDTAKAMVAGMRSIESQMQMVADSAVRRAGSAAPASPR